MDTQHTPLRTGRQYYKTLFTSYPDVVSLSQFRQMLGGISDQTARKLMHENLVYHFYIRTTFYIPKESVIDYVLSKHYKTYRSKLRAQI